MLECQINSKVNKNGFFCFLKLFLNNRLMKKYIALMLLTPVLSFAQADNFAQIEGEFLSAGKKQLDYELSISEGEILLFKSDFSIKNGEKLVLFKREIQKNKDTINGKKLSLGDKPLSVELESGEEKVGDLEILRLSTEIVKETKNIVSTFTTLNAYLAGAKKETAKKSVAEGDGELEGNFVEESPSVEKMESKISISHKSDKDILFVSDEKTYRLKAKY